MNYEDLLIEADNTGLIVKEKPLPISKGRIKGEKIAIRQTISTQKEKTCILAEEMGHYHTNAMDILDQDQIMNRKLERAGRLWAYDKMIGLSGIIQGYQAGCRNRCEFAECLGVTEEFLQDALICYKEKYGIMTEIDGYVIMFEPSLAVAKKLD